MSATKTVGFIVLIGVGIYAVYYFMNKKVEAAETKAGLQIDALSAGLKSGVAGIVTSLGAGVKGLVGGLAKTKVASTAGAAAGAKFVGPLQPAAAGLGMGTEAGAGAFSGMSATGIGAFVAVATLWVYTAFRKLFPSKSAEEREIDRKIEEARAAGTLVTQVRKAQLKAPVR